MGCEPRRRRPRVKRVPPLSWGLTWREGLGVKYEKNKFFEYNLNYLMDSLNLNNYKFTFKAFFMGNKYELVFCDPKKSIEYLELIFLNSKYPPSIKFALRNVEYSIKYYSSKGLKSIISHSEEITYHSSMYKGSELIPAVLHLKSNKIELNKIIPISHNIHDIIECDFPIPICRIIFNGLSLPHLKRKSNKHYFELTTDIREFNNGIDLFIVRKSSFDKFPYLWPRYSLLFQISEIDYLFQGVMPNYPLFTSLNSGSMISLEAEKI
jgi:hypothetical protein